MSTRPWRVVVAGTNFGRVHARGVLRAPDEFRLVGILSRGSERSRGEADAFGVPHVSSVDDVPDGVDAACVAVGSAVSGGAGTELAQALLARGIAVLAEHPMHPDELTACLRTARRHGTLFRITTHYPHVRPVRRFLDAAARLRARQRPLFVDAATPVHVLQPMLDVLGRALGGVRPWAFGDPPAPESLAGTAAGPLRSLPAVVGGVPVTLRVHNQLHPGDRDNHALLWHRIAIGTEGGVLTLADTHGPVLWSPRFHASRDADRRLVLDGTGLDLPSTTVAEPAGTLADVVTTLWPDAVAHALRGLRAGVETGADPLRDGQFDLTVARMWTDLVTRLGPPESVRPAPPEVLTAEDVLGPDPSAPDPAVPDPVVPDPATPDPAGRSVGDRAPAATRAGRPVIAGTRGPGAPTHHDRTSPRSPTTTPTVIAQTSESGAPAHPTRTSPRPPADPAAAPAPDATPDAAPDTALDTAAGDTAYGRTAEFYELGAAGPVAAGAADVVAALAGVDPSAGPVVEIGAGTGLVTAIVARALPGARILAAEPSPVLRAVLTSRVVRDPDLRERVTVRPDRAQELVLPPRIAAVVACGVLGHLDRDERVVLWARMAERLAPGAPVVVELMAMDRPATLPDSRLATARLGRRDYEWWYAAEPAGTGDAVALRSTWRVRDAAGAVVREETELHRWHAFGPDVLAAETGFAFRSLRGRAGDVAAPLAVFTRAT